MNESNLNFTMDRRRMKVKGRNLLVVMVAALVLLCAGGTAFAQDIWVGSDDTGSGHCEVYLDTDSITRSGPSGNGAFTLYEYKCTLKFVNGQGNLMYKDNASYKWLSFPYTTESGQKVLARAWFYDVSRNGSKIENGKLNNAKGYYKEAFEHIKVKYK